MPHFIGRNIKVKPGGFTQHFGTKTGRGVERVKRYQDSSRAVCDAANAFLAKRGLRTDTFTGHNFGAMAQR